VKKGNFERPGES